MKTRTAIFIAVATLLQAACTSTSKLMDRGEYDEVVDKVIGKLEGKKNKNTAQVKLLEEGFNNLVENDMAEIKALRARGHADDLERIIDIAGSVGRRQQQIKAFLPLTSKDGYRAKFRFIDTGYIIADAEQALADRLKYDVEGLMDLARNGDKDAARIAYGMYDRMFTLGMRDDTLAEAREQARDLGILKVLISHEVDFHLRDAGYLEERLASMNIFNGDFWTHAVTDPDAEADVELRIEVDDIRISPNIIRNEETPRTRRISDGWDYVLDERGNVAKDSSGNDIKVERFIEVTGVAVQTIQEREIDLDASIRIIDLRQNTIVETIPLREDVRFYHRARTYYGDARALNSSERQFVGMLPFPGDSDMIDMALDRFQSRLAREMKKHISRRLQLL